MEQLVKSFSKKKRDFFKNSTKTAQISIIIFIEKRVFTLIHNP